jgi:hypothetical protein
MVAAPPDLVPAADLSARHTSGRDQVLRLLVDRLGLDAGIEAEAPSDPPVDLAWRRDDGTYVVADAADSPGADGLARVLDHRRRLAERRPRVEAVLLVPRVDDPRWYEVCAFSGVRLLAGNSPDDWLVTAWALSCRSWWSAARVQGSVRAWSVGRHLGPARAAR